MSEACSPRKSEFVTPYAPGQGVDSLPQWDELLAMTDASLGVTHEVSMHVLEHYAGLARTPAAVVALRAACADRASARYGPGSPDTPSARISYATALQWVGGKGGGVLPAARPDRAASRSRSGPSTRKPSLPGTASPAYSTAPHGLEDPRCDAHLLHRRVDLLADARRWLGDPTTKHARSRTWSTILAKTCGWLRRRWRSLRR